MNEKKCLSLLGIARKAGKIKSGEFQTETAIKKGDAFLVLVAEDASDNTRKKFSDQCAYRHVPVRSVFSKEELGHAVGLEMRSALAVTDEGLAGSVLGILDGDG